MVDDALAVPQLHDHVAVIVRRAVHDAGFPLGQHENAVAHGEFRKLLFFVRIDADQAAARRGHGGRGLRYVRLRAAVYGAVRAVSNWGASPSRCAICKAQLSPVLPISSWYSGARVSGSNAMRARSTCSAVSA